MLTDYKNRFSMQRYFNIDATFFFKEIYLEILISELYLKYFAFISTKRKSRFIPLWC